MNTTRYIYTLEHPTTNEIRYIGQTVDLRKRLFKHLKSHNSDIKTHRAKWIKSLIEQGLKPVMKLLEVCTVDTVDDLEVYYISQFKAWGFRLVNSSLGGQSKVSVSTETKLKLSQSLKEYYAIPRKRQPMSQETKDKISATKALKPQSRVGINTKEILDTSNGMIFKSIKLAAESIGMHPNHLGCCLSGKSKNFTNFVLH